MRANSVGLGNPWKKTGGCTSTSVPHWGTTVHHAGAPRTRNSQKCGRQTRLDFTEQEMKLFQIFATLNLRDIHVVTRALIVEKLSKVKLVTRKFFSTVWAVWESGRNGGWNDLDRRVHLDVRHLRHRADRGAYWGVPQNCRLRWRGRRLHWSRPWSRDRWFRVTKLCSLRWLTLFSGEEERLHPAHQAAEHWRPVQCVGQRQRPVLAQCGSYRIQVSLPRRRCNIH